MVRFLLTISAIMMASGSYAATTVVQCGLKTPNHGTEWVALKLDSKGRITPWDKSKWGMSSKGAYWLNIFSENVHEYGFEWQNSFRAKNGYSILELGTTADGFKVGVNLTTGKGFFSYRDYGSGAGNYGPYTMVCRKKK